MFGLPQEVFWIALIVIFVIAEALTVGLISIWFALGALAGLIASSLGANLWIQVVVFLAVSLLSFFCMRRWALKGIWKKSAKTDVDRIIGTQVVIIETVDNAKNQGKVKINDLEWKVKSETNEIISAGEYATVEGVEGVRLIVKKAI